MVELTPLSVKDIDGVALSSGTWVDRMSDCWMSWLKTLISFVYRKLREVIQVGTNLNVNISSG